LPSKLILVRVIQKTWVVAFANISSTKNNKTLNLLYLSHVYHYSSPQTLNIYLFPLCHQNHFKSLPFTTLKWKVIAWLGHVQQVAFFFIFFLWLLYVIKMSLLTKSFIPQKMGPKPCFEIVVESFTNNPNWAIDHVLLNLVLSSFSTFL